MSDSGLGADCRGVFVAPVWQPDEKPSRAGGRRRNGASAAFAAKARDIARTDCTMRGHPMLTTCVIRWALRRPRPGADCRNGAIARTPARGRPPARWSLLTFSEDGLHPSLGPIHLGRSRCGWESTPNPAARALAAAPARSVTASLTRIVDTVLATVLTEMPRRWLMAWLPRPAPMRSRICRSRLLNWGNGGCWWAGGCAGGRVRLRRLRVRRWPVPR